MRKYILFSFLMLCFSFISIYGQFGKNKVQYKNYTWYFIQTKHFDVYFSQGGEKIAAFAAKAAEDALTSIQNSFQYRINNRMTFIIYKSANDFQETNVTDEYLEEGIGGFTELFKNRVVLPFDGSYKAFRHVIHHELVHAVINDMFYGGSLQNIISKNITIQLPLWFNEGMAEYQSLGWDTNTDMFIRDAIINEYLPDIPYLGGYFAYRGGQSVFYYIADKYGKEKIGEIINRTRSLSSLEEALKASIGLNIEELNERWKKDLKKKYWPDIAEREDPDEFSKRLTNHKKDGGSYNTSPAISPQGDKVAFITNRNFYFDVYIMSAIDGKIITKLVEGNRSNDFEELNILTPGLDWSPDGTKIVLSAKSSGYDNVNIIDVESEDRETLPIQLDGISSVKWSPDGKALVFIGHNGAQSDVFIYEFASKQTRNLTNDIFSENDPVWSSDSKKIYFTSDRGGFSQVPVHEETFDIFKHDYSQMDLFSINLENNRITRLTDLPFSDETSPVVSPDGKEILFISSMNGINNIFKQNLEASEANSKSDSTRIENIPITNSLNGLYQLSLSRDGKKLVFSSMYESAYNIFLLSNPFEPKTKKRALKPTVYYSKLLKTENLNNNSLALVKIEDDEDTETTDIQVVDQDSTETDSASRGGIFTGQYEEDPETESDSSSASGDYGRYVFGRNIFKHDSSDAIVNPEFTVTDNLDEDSNYVVNKYKITFSPDIIYANAGYSTLYGLLGTTVLSFSDIMGNHRIIGVTSLQIDLKNSDYGLAYYYLPKRVDFGIEGFHTARFVYLDRGSFQADLYRFRNFGLVGSINYPLNKFYRLEGGLSLLNVSSENLDNINEPNERLTYLIPSLSFVHDNVLWGYTAPIDGTRYNLTLFGNPLPTKARITSLLGEEREKELSFYSILWDYRNYSRFWYDYSFAFRLSGGYSGGANPQRFFIGGTENWINRTFSQDEIPIESASDFAFLTPGLPLRGYDYAEQIGTKYALMNLELRMPLIRYLVTGPIPLLFQNILGTAFIDMGSAWTKNKDLQFFTKTGDGVITKDLLMGTGFGARIFFLYFLLRFDVAWKYDLDHFSKPRYYISLGADF